MKYEVLGPRLLLKVPKANKYYPGTEILIPENQVEKETALQVRAEIVQLGPSALSHKENGCDLDSLKVGDMVHFQRYGAIRLTHPDEPDIEYWVINAGDILVIERE